MPEGDTLFRAATNLRNALLGKRLIGFETEVDHVRNQIEGVLLMRPTDHAGGGAGQAPPHPPGSRR